MRSSEIHRSSEPGCDCASEIQDRIDASDGHEQLVLRTCKPAAIRQWIQVPAYRRSQFVPALRCMPPFGHWRNRGSGLIR